MGCNASHHQDRATAANGATEHKWDVTEDAPSQNGRVVVITGCNSGVGEVTVEYMLQKGATVVMACRNMKRARNASKDILDRVEKRAEKIKKTRKSNGEIDSHEGSDNEREGGVKSYAQAVRVGLAGTPPANERLFVEELDLNSFASIRAFAQRVEQRAGAFKLGSIDTLILNAGVMNLRKLEKTVDGFERQWQTNYLGHFLLVGELMPSLRRSTHQPIIVPVSALEAQKSELNTESAFDFKFEKEWQGKYKSEHVYADTKLATLLFATELRERHGSWLRVVPCHPGVCNTRLFRHSIKTLLKPTYEPASQGATLEMRAATDTSLENGTYIGTGGTKAGEPIEEAPGHQAVNATTARTLWEYSEQSVGITY